MNSAIAGAKDPVLMAHAMKPGVEARRARRVVLTRYASTSSPIAGII